MKARKIFSALMIAAAICTTGFMMTSCHDEEDVMIESKTIKVESDDIYRTKDDVNVEIKYNVVADVSCYIERTASEWVNLIKKDINKEVNYVVGEMKYDDLSTEIFDDIYDTQNNKDYTLGLFKDIKIKKIESENKNPDEENKDSEEEKDPSDNLDKVSVSATSTYMTKDNYAIVLSYDAELWETIVNEEKGVDEWTSFLKDVCEKVFKESVENVNWTDGKENFDNFMFGESGWGLYVANGFNGCIHESEMGVKYNCTFKIDEYPAEVVKNETLYSVSIEEGTLFTCRNKTYNRPESNYIWSMDWSGYSKLKVKTCEIKYSENLEIDGDGDVKDFLFEKVNVAVSDYIGGLVMKDLYLSSGESIDVFLDNVLIECEKHIKTLFNMENDNFEIVDFEIMKGAAKNYWINSCAMYGDTSGYDYKYIYNEYKAWKDNR